MYDIPGADSGREWVEVHNTGPDSVDLSGWKFFENDVNHRLTSLAESVIAAGGYAVIVSNTDKFIADWPQFSGSLFKSSFSLSNSGEKLVLKNSASQDAASITYSSSVADGDGNSLNAFEGTWVPRKPTPGGALSSDTIPPPAPKKASSKRNSAAPGKVSTYDSAGTPGAVSNTAAAGLAVSGPQSFTGLVPWLVALVAVIGIAAAAIFLGRKKETRSGYTIIEDET